MPKRKATSTKSGQQTAAKPLDAHEVKKQKLSSVLEAASTTKSELPAEIEADADAPDAQRLTVYIDRAAGVAYDVMLNQTNIGQNNNKYFVLQVLHEKTGANGRYIVFFKWGRVGYKGQVSVFGYDDVEEALTTFKKKFREKTGNKFEDRKEFVFKSGKYDLIEIDYSKRDEEPAPVDGSKPKPKDDASIPSKLDVKVKAVVDRICDMRLLERYLKNLNYDAKKAPLGRITKAQIKAGFEVLSQIERKLLDSEFDAEYERLVSSYYTKIPHDFGFRRPKLLQTMEEFKDELALLEALSDVEVAASAMKEEDGIVPMNPSDRNYERLKCEIVPLEKKKNATYKLIETYLKNTKGPTHWYDLELQNVFKIERHGEADQHATSIHNRMLLWHGSGLANWFGILSQGLRIAPPEAPCSGYMFGKGVYFADCVSKSAGYCRAGKGDIFYMTLAEVALGNPRPLRDGDYNASNLPSGYHSTHGLGGRHPDEKGHKKTKLDGNEVIVPCGKMVEKPHSGNYCLYYNEFIVYNTAQIRLRYLLEIKMV